MGSTGLGLLLEEHRGEIVSSWRQRVQRELGVTEPALAFAVAPLLREMALALGGAGAEARSRDAWARCAVLVRSTAAAPQLAREFKLLHRCVWDALRARGAPVSQSDRTAADEWLDEALAESLERLERVRIRAASFERVPVIVPAAPRGRTTPPPLPRARPAQPASTPAPAPEVVLDLDPIR